MATKSPRTEPKEAPIPISFKTHSGYVTQVPDASLLFNPPKALGLDDLSANDRYQIVLLSLQAKKVDASEILYKKAKKDSKEDPSWRRAGCSICYDSEDLDDSGRLLACQCRAHIYCKDCVEEWIKKSRVRAEGLISCPQCRGIVYTVSSAWVFLTPDEEEHRIHYREDRKAKKRAKNKQNKREAELRKRVRLSEEAHQRKEALRASKVEGVHRNLSTAP
ncbi:zinc ion binding [Paramarasmius palmivorus]|uniref:Zinc ion binding n=1 Tax=Paramarasmius palmivorus TaxID=297713 RepID=A0AAW0BXF9_9AGAR